jgi:hypothetical protein
LLQNVLLRVTSSETVHPVEDWFHEIDGTGVFISPIRQHTLRYGQSYNSNDGSVAKTERAHRIKRPTGAELADAPLCPTATPLLMPSLGDNLD